MLTGHSHTYERSFFIDGHYGSSSSFDPGNHVVVPGDGREGGDGVYSKNAVTPLSRAGSVYVVAGSSGQTEDGSLDHPAMFLSLEELGSVVLDIDGNRLDARFLRESGEIDDSFTIVKGDQPPPPPGPVHAQTVTGSSSSSGAVRSGTVGAFTDHLYLAAVSTRPLAAVSSVSGLGLTWTRVRAQCAGRGTTGVEVWQARGAPSGAGQVTASLASSSGRAVIAVSRYLGSSGVGASASANTSSNAACSGGSDRSSYTVSLTTTVPNAVRYGAVALRNRTHQPGSGYSERADLRRGSGSSAAGQGVEDRAAPTVSNAPVDGTLSGTTDWAAVAVEIKP